MGTSDLYCSFSLTNVFWQELAPWLGEEEGAEMLSANGEGEGRNTDWPVSPLVRYSCVGAGLLPEAVTAWISV